MEGAIVKSRLAAFAAAFVGAVGTALSGSVAFAGEPRNWQLGLQDPGSLTAARIDSFHDVLTWMMAGISLFVMVLLLIVIFRFNEKANPTPTKTTHNVVLEIAWTIVPVIILVLMAIPSFSLLYYADRVEDPDMTLKITGHQWYWSYEYPDHGGFGFDANMVSDDDIAKNPQLKRLMDTDNRVILPAGKKIQLLMTSADVIHNWGIASLGVKVDSVPGRLNETWVQVNEPGVYYGFCSELCGVAHAFMPITIEVVSPEDFDKWVEEAKVKFARSDDGTAPAVRIAQNNVAD
ncbi:MAG: cytochrome c oxidase subunit II [Proteobacteria bacterium]|nr:cytochrome c oxidase subunit II [Pseudomonadota bacterium]